MSCDPENINAIKFSLENKTLIAMQKLNLEMEDNCKTI